MAADPNPAADPIVVVLSSDDDDDENQSAASRSSHRTTRPPGYKKWLFCDEATILTELSTERRRFGRLPPASKLLDMLREKKLLRRANVTVDDVSKKVTSLKAGFKKACEPGGLSKEPRDRMLFYLSVEVWPELQRY